MRRAAPFFPLFHVFLCISALLLSGFTAKRVPIIHHVGEKEANEIIVYLANHNIAAHKIGAAGQGAAANRQPSLFHVVVDEKRSTAAMSFLNQAGIPRNRSQDLLELFAKQGLMSSEKEEAIRYQAGLASQISNIIRKVEGVIDADVQISLPIDVADKGAEKARPTASVYVKCQGVLDQPNSHLVSKIKRIVAGSVHGLALNDVTVISDRALPLPEKKEMPRADRRVWSIIISQHSVTRFRLLFSLLALLASASLLLSSWLIWKVYPILQRYGGMRQLLTPFPLAEQEKGSSDPQLADDR